MVAQPMFQKPPIPSLMRANTNRTAAAQDFVQNHAPQPLVRQIAEFIRGVRGNVRWMQVQRIVKNRARSIRNPRLLD